MRTLLLLSALMASNLFAYEIKLPNCNVRLVTDQGSVPFYKKERPYIFAKAHLEAKNYRLVDEEINEFKNATLNLYFNISQKREMFTLVTKTIFAPNVFGLIEPKTATSITVSSVVRKAIRLLPTCKRKI